MVGTTFWKTIVIYVHVAVNTYMSWHMLGGQRTAFESLPTPSTMQISGIGLRLLGWAAVAFTC